MCPSADLLFGFTSGDLSPDQHAALESHIDVCPECRAVLSSLVQGSVPEPHVARYRIETVLGGGGMGLIYRAFDPQLARAVAIKVVKHARDDESLQIQLVREAQSLARLSHPNVCHVYDAGREGDEVWVAMELIDGVDLRLWAAGRPAADVEAVLVDAARGLAAAHAAGLVHRDVKPENVLVTRDGRAVVTDFGLARRDDASVSSLTAAGVVSGTPAYLAPEQLTASPLDARVDQFAWAVMTWELLTGERPFPVEPAPRLAAIREGVTRPRGLEGRLGEALVRALAVAPRDRFASMDGLVAALTRQPPSRWRPAAIALVVLIITGGAIGFLRVSNREPEAALADAAMSSPASSPSGSGPPTAAPASLPRDDIAKLVAQQIEAASDRADPADAKAPYAEGVKIVITDAKHAAHPLLDPTEIKLHRLQDHAEKNLEVQLSRDGNTAWASVETEVGAAGDREWLQTYRISDVVAKIGGRWRIVASAWSEGIDNVKANKAAQSRTPPQLAPLGGGKPDPWMEGELLAWQSGARTTTVARKTIVFGSAPRERTTDGPSFRKAWYATWANHVRIEPQKIAALAPSGTTGWVIANITLDKKTHKVPFRMFVVFDKDAAGNWQLVHVHLATPS